MLLVHILIAAIIAGLAFTCVVLLVRWLRNKRNAQQSTLVVAQSRSPTWEVSMFGAGPPEPEQEPSEEDVDPGSETRDGGGNNGNGSHVTSPMVMATTPQFSMSGGIALNRNQIHLPTPSIQMIQSVTSPYQLVDVRTGEVIPPSRYSSVLAGARGIRVSS